MAAVDEQPPVPPGADVKAVSGMARQESLLYLPGKLVRAMMGALTLPILTVMFGPADIGRYDLTIRFVDFLYTICALWLGTVIVRYFSIYQQRQQLPLYLKVVGTVQAAGIAFGLCLLVITRLFGPDSLFGSYRTLLDVAAPMFIGYTVYESGLMMLRARSKALVFSISSAASAFGRIIVGLLLAWKLGISGMLWGTAIVNFAIYLIAMRRYFGRIEFKITPEEKLFLREMLYYGLPLCLSATVAYLLGNGDRYILKYVLGEPQSDQQVGLLAVGSLFAEQPLFVIYSTLMLAVFPAASRIFDHHGRHATETFTRSETRVYLLLAAPLLVLLMVYAKPFLSMFPGKYIEAWQVMPWVALGTFLMGLSQYPAQGLLIVKRTRWIFMVNIAAVLLNLFVNWLLIPHFGFVACGMARVAANAFLVVAMAAISYGSLTWRLPPLTVARVTLAGLVMALAAYFGFSLLPPELPRVPNLAALCVFSAASLVIYVLVLLASRELRLRELMRKLNRAA